MEAPFPCLADRQRKGYNAFGLKRGNLWSVLLNPLVLRRGFQAGRKGHHIEKVVGDAFQLPGTFIIDREGVVRYSNYASHAGDHPYTDELLAALRAI